MFVHFEGSSIANPLTPEEGYLLLAHPAIADVLVLHEFADGGNPFSGGLTGWHGSDGRTVGGALQRSGASAGPFFEFNADHLVVQPQLDLFHSLLLAQQSAPGITVYNHFDSPATSIVVWIDLDQNYNTRYSALWRRLQFTGRTI